MEMKVDSTTKTVTVSFNETEAEGLLNWADAMDSYQSIADQLFDCLEQALSDIRKTKTT